ncbi:MAG TPA: hypothetical protein VGA70_10020, partial [Longimicrobiales bacterium]
MLQRSSPPGDGVLPIIRSVRSRWRLRIALRGASILLATAFAAFLLSAFGLEAARFSPGAVTALRLAAWAVVALVAVVFLVRPLLRRVSDEQVALYLEEHEPSLEAAILGAVEAEREGTTERMAVSPALLRRLVERAVDRARDVEYGRRIDQPGLYRSSGALAGVTLAVLLFLVLGPSNLRYGMGALLFPTTDAADVSPYSIAVLPGDVTVARGSDQFISAEPRGFDADEVSVFTRSADGQPYQRLSMLPSDSGSYELLLLNLLESTDYFVESNGIRSATYTIEVAELPYVDQLRHTYNFPAYTGLRPREVEDGGDIAALAGTVVDMVIHPTIPTPGGRLLVDDVPVMDLTRGADGTFTATLTVTRRGVYEIELARVDGAFVPASPEFAIDVLRDQPPSITISKPGRDTPASPIEEVFIEVRADDDYGIADVRLVWSVNGAPEDTLALFHGAGEPLAEVSAGHTMFLEEWELEAGDVVSYYAVARDNRAVDAGEVVSDIYFLEIRPFRIDFRQAEQQPGGGGGGGGGGGAESALSELQKEVVAATFNLLRDEERYTSGEFSENTVTVALAQGRVKEQVATLVERMNNRGIAQADPEFQAIAEMLPEAIADMESAEALLREGEPREALAPEQRALRVLQKAEETYERFVGEQQGGGGGGGGGGANADDLADLFELELDKLRNQYETVQRGERQQASNEVDELMERLKELARRQQQEMERQRQRAAAQQGGGGGSQSRSQRELADSTEAAARQLEELSRRTGDERLAETARQLQEAADAMRRSAASSGRSQGTADAASALDDLAEAQRRLRRAQEDRSIEEAQDALDRVERLAESQRQVQESVERLPDDSAERREGVQRIHERKDQMLSEAQELERQLHRMRDEAQGENPEAVRALDEAIETIQEGKLKEKLQYTKGVVEQRDREFAGQWEDQIASDIEALREQVAEAARATDRVADDRGLEDALDRTRDLVRGAESLGRRLDNRGQPGEEGQQAEGQQGEQGQQG